MRIDTTLRSVLTIAIGVVLLALGIVLAVTTERGVQSYQTALQDHGGAVLDLGSNAEPSPNLQGKVVRLSGTPRVVESPYDADFNQQAATPVLTRHVEMFQWHELRMGDSATYELDWADTPQDSSRFTQPAGHANPGPFPIHGKRFDAGRVELDGFKLDAALVNALPGSEPFAPDVKSLPSNLAASFSLYRGALVTSATPGDPRLGDLRVSWSTVPLREITVIASVDGDELVPVPNADDGMGYEVDVGDSTLLDMRPDMAAQPSPMSTWLRRVLAFVLIVSGARLVMARDVQRIENPRAMFRHGLWAVGVYAALMLPWSKWIAAAWVVAILIEYGVRLWRRRATRH